MLFLSALIVLAWHVRARAKVLAPRGLLWLTTATVYLQILLGATVRHTGAGLVCTDLPLCRGALWPVNVHPSVHLHMTHRALAFVVLALVAWTSSRVARRSTGLVRALALAAPALVLLQIGLGIATILTFKDLVPVTAHLLVAALLLATQVSLLALTRAQPAEAHAPALQAAV
jgi:cytochrome c oxidase assembly protein subunit 15